MPFIHACNMYEKLIETNRIKLFIMSAAVESRFLNTNALCIFK